MKKLIMPLYMRRFSTKDEVVELLYPVKRERVHIDREIGRGIETLDILYVEDYQLDFVVGCTVAALYGGTCTKERYLVTAVLLKESKEIELLHKLQDAYSELKSIGALEFQKPKKEGFLAKLWRLFRGR